MKRYLSMITALILCLAIMLNFTACTEKQITEKPDITDLPETKDPVNPANKEKPVLELKSTDLMSAVTANDVTPRADLKEKSEVFTDFAVRLFKECEENGENTLVSPLSVLCALSMTLNGARGETRAEMEEVLGMSAEELNEYIYTYMSILPSTEEYKLSLANSIWFTDDSRFTVNGDFLQKNADYYDADIYQAPFNDETKEDINNWVNNKTDGMIEGILDKIPEEAVMYLINALAFDAKWEVEYKESQIRDGIFTTENGEEQNVEFMYSDEGVYLEDEDAKGFAKYYKDGKYAFVALLPDEGTSISDYVASLTGKKLHDMLTYSKNTVVNTAIPKFESEYDIEMSDVLKKMGMPTAFSGMADFTDLGTSTEGPVHISRVLHKTFISVDETGTKAAAVTAVEMVDECCVEPAETKEVILDRPFVYMLIDTETDIPFFIGTTMSTTK
ncbi:MAG: serine protease [Ruminococcaceae bacterium]|nr:serine protease [Oscillospiraceae bacterium]